VLEPGARVVAWKELCPGDACLNEAGFFPGVLMVELMAQAGGLLVDDSQGEPGGYGVLAGIKRMHLHAAAGAGETIRVEGSLVRRMGDLYMIECRARTEGGPAERALGHGTIQIRMVRGGLP
jgi:3-hydroxymyristoyl/3-hydroxydecanoyl-(acyl carrier protein) dehydratase